MRILLVEDNSDHRALIRLALTGHDSTWEVEEVGSGKEALRRLAEGETYDVVFLDYSLPERDGVGVLEEIRRGEAPPPVVMVTGRGDEQVAVEAMKGGAYDYVIKAEGYLQRLPMVAQRAMEVHQLAVERKRAEERLKKLNGCLVSFGADPVENINRLVALCGERLGATCALYNRLEDGVLCSVGQWNVPPEFIWAGKPERYVCFDLINANREEVHLVRNLDQTIYGQTDPNVALCNLKTYVGKGVFFGDAIIGSLCVIYQKDYIPNEDDQTFLGIVAAAIGVEEKREYAEHALRFTRFSVDNATETIVWTNKEGHFIDVNDAFCRISGYSREELLSMVVHDTDPNYPREIWPEYWRKLNEAGSLTFESYHRMKNGRLIPVEITINYLEYEGKEYHCSFARDITERKQAEETLRRAEENYRRSLDESPLGVRIVTEKGETLYANKATLNIYGYDSIEEMRTTPAKKRYTPESYVGHQRRKEQRQRGEDSPSEYEISIVTTKGDIRHLQVFRKEVLWNNEKQFQTLYHDITERKRLEEILEQERQELKLIIDSSPIIVFYKDKEGRLLRVNKTFSEALNISEKSVVGKTVFDLYSPEIAQGMTDDDHEVLKSGHSKLNIIERYESANGIRWVQTDKIPIFDTNGIVAGIIGFSQDITERKRAEKEGERLLEQLKLGRKRLQHLSQRLVEIQETERHELARELHDKVGQSLTALIINLKIIQNLLPEEIRDRVSTRIDDSRKLVGETVVCIRDVMAKLRPPVLDDYGLLAALQWYSKQFVERTGIVMEVRGEELNPRLPIEKETALFRIAQEALNNVAKHAKASQVTLTLESGGGKGRLTIADDGIGFDPKTHHQPGREPEWGLINMRERAEAIEGKFDIEIAPGKGTKIIVEVPRKE